MTETTDRPPSPGFAESLANLARLLRLARPYWRQFAGGTALGLAVGAVGVAVPYVTKLLIDRVYPSRDVGLLHLLIGLLLALTVAKALAGALRSYYVVHVKTRLENALRLLFFNHLQHLPMRFFESHQVGEVTSRFQGVVRGVDTLSLLADQAFLGGVYLLLVPPALVWLEPRLAVLALAVVPLVSLVTVASSRLLRRRWQRSSEAAADLDAYQVEVLTRIRTFKGLGLESTVFAETRRRMRTSARAALHAARGAQGFSAASALLRAVGTAAIAWYGWRLILAGSLTLGGLIAFTTYVTYLYAPLFLLAQAVSDLQRSAVHLGRMFEYLDETPEQDPAQAGGAVPAAAPPTLRGDYALAGVRFAYGEGGDGAPVLDGLTLDLPAGSATAVIGASGSGKTTLLRLLAGFDRPGGGRLTLDGRSLADVPLAELRRAVSVVWQEAGLVRGSLWHNLTLGCTEPPEPEQVDAAVSACGLEKVVAGLPDGYDSAVSEAGASLSAGQQQRVALVRALLREAPILLLDEATANVDVETERSILDHLLRPAAGRTLVFVTHRLDAAARADRLVVLDEGRLAGVGPHRQLLAGCSVYRRLLGEPESEPASGPRPLAVGEAR